MCLPMSGSQWIVQGVLDHSHHDALAILVTVVRRRVDLCQARPVRKPFDRFQNHVALDPDQELHTPRIQLFPVVVAEEISILEQQGVVRDLVEKLHDQFLLAVVIATDGQSCLHVGAQFDEAQLADLRKGCVTTATATATETLLIGRRVRHIHYCAVDAHQAVPLVEGTRRFRRRQRMNHEFRRPAARVRHPDADAPRRGCCAKASFRWAAFVRVLEDLANR